MEIEQLEDVAEVDQKARGLAWLVSEGLGADPGAALLAGRAGVVDLGLLALVPRHEGIITARGLATHYDGELGAQEVARAETVER